MADTQDPQFIELVRQAGGEFDALVNEGVNGEPILEKYSHLAQDLLLLVDSAVNMKLIYMNHRAQQVARMPQIGAQSFMPASDPTEE